VRWFLQLLALLLRLIIFGSPGLVSFGSPLALEDIQGEPSTHDGNVHDPFQNDTPKIIDSSVIRAADGLQFAARDTLYDQYL
jgi:hypothetical protein